MLMKQRTVKILLSIVVAVLLIVLFSLFLGDSVPLIKDLFQQDLSNEEVRARLTGIGMRGYCTIAILSMLQVVCTFLPAEPIQVLAGLSFGFPIGLLCCSVGVVAGNTVIFLLYKAFGNRLRQYFLKNLHFDFEKAANSARITAVIFLLYFLPAIPYGMICFFAASIGMKFHRYIFVTVLGAIPSVCIGVGLGNMTLTASWILSLCVFLILIMLLILLSRKREWLFAKINAFAARPAYSSKTTVRPCSRFLLLPIYACVRAYFFLRGIRISAVNKCGKAPEGPAIVLCNHGSFIDFLYAETLLLKSNPSFVVARLYFYHKWLGGLLRRLGCFPKSMFALDLESTKNCLRVIKNGGVLAMMPEARLSTAGSFEDIQEGTFAFLKKAAAPVYTIKISGDYFANPKWGKGMRRGSLVEAELDLLYTPEELSSLSTQEIQKGVEERLYYNEFQWLETKPNIRYSSKVMAEGLENILTTCPQCKKKYTLVTKGHSISCRHCGKLTEINERYAFSPDFRFQNFGQWYDWQKELLQQEITNNPDYTLSSPVALRRHSQDGKSLTRPAGQGHCILDRSGLRYVGTMDGQDCDLHFPLKKIYRLLFGAGENFETYQGNEIFYFVPEEKASAVEWYMASMILYDHEL